jgi:hypothetical protein
MVVNKIGVWSVARVYGAMLAALGLLFGACVALFSLIGAGLAGANSDVPGWMSAVLGVGAVIALPIFYGVMGLVMGALMAALYNIFAGMVGGISIDVS